jgi:hypothetical protein
VLGIGLGVGLWAASGETWRGAPSPVVVRLNATTDGTAALVTNAAYSYNYAVDWGDGSPLETITGPGGITAHTFPVVGADYDVRIYPLTYWGFPAFRFNNNATYRTKLRKILAWGNNGWRSFAGAFYGCNLLNDESTDGAEARTEKVVSISQMCTSCAAMVRFALSYFPAAVAINSVFNGCVNLIDVPALTLGSASGLGTFLMNGTKVVTPPLFKVSGCSTFTSVLDGCGQATSYPEFDFANGTSFLNCMRNMTALAGFDPPFVLNLRKMTTGTQFFQGSRISTAGWSALLVDLAANNPNNNVQFHGGTSKYNAAGAIARATLVGRGWTITDGGLEP